MITDENQWDVDILYDIFDDRDVNLILSVPIRENERDIWYWRKEKLGNYSIKTAYVLIQGNKESNSINASNRQWKRMWNLKIPPKVKNLMWHATSGCLPTKVQLRTKQVNIDDLCPM